MKTKRLPVADILVGTRWRTPTAKQIAMMQDSLRDNGLLVPIGVRLANEGNGKNRKTWILVYGATRLAAAKEEGWSKIEARILEGSDVTLEMAELAENLHRGELSKLERDRHIARYIELCGSKGILRGDRAKIGRGRPEGGLRAAARQLHVAPSTARDAMRVATITEPAAAVVTELGLADNPTAYRAVAAAPTAKAQVAKAREIAGNKAKGHANTVIKARGSQVDALMAAWKDARAAARREFLTGIGHAGCHGTAGPGAVGTPRRAPRSENTSGVAARGRKAPQEEGQLQLDLTKGIRLNGGR
jgi:ParB family chromosome partitioning protein